MPTIQLNIPKITDGNVFKTLWKPRLLFLENTTLPDSWYYGTDSEYNSVTPCTKYKTLGFNYTEIGDSDNLVLNFNNDITYTEDASLSNITLYNKFYKEDIELNLDDNAYLITLKVRLNKNDIRDLDFSKRIYLKDSKIGGGIFRLNSIKKYVPDGLSTVELIKLNYLDASYDSTIVPTNITRTNYSTTEIVSSGGSSSSSSSSSSSINPDNFVLKSGDTMNGGLNVPSLEVTGETFLSGIANASTGYLLYYDPSDDSVTYATTLSGGGGGYVSGDLHVTGELEVDDTIFAYDDFVLDGDLQANGDVYFQGIDASIKDNILYYDPVSNKVFYGSTDSASYWDVSNGKLTYTDNPLFFASALVDDVIEWANGNAIDGDGAHFTNGDGVITCTEFECESFLADEDAVINNQLYLPYLDASVESNVLYYNTTNGNVTYGPGGGSGSFEEATYSNTYGDFIKPDSSKGILLGDDRTGTGGTEEQLYIYGENKIAGIAFDQDGISSTLSGWRIGTGCSTGLDEKDFYLRKKSGDTLLIGDYDNNRIDISDLNISDKLYLSGIDSSVELNVLFYNYTTKLVTYGSLNNYVKDNVTNTFSADQQIETNYTLYFGDTQDGGGLEMGASGLDFTIEKGSTATYACNFIIANDIPAIYLNSPSIYFENIANEKQDKVLFYNTTTGSVTYHDPSLSFDASLGGLADVDIYDSSLANEDIIYYDSITQTWYNAETLDADDYYIRGSGILGTIDLTGIGINQDGSALIYDADTSTWTFGFGGKIDPSLMGLLDVDIEGIGIAQDGSALVYDSDTSTWTFGVASGSSGSSSLEDLTDTSINADPSLNSSLVYLDSKWVDQETLDASSYFIQGIGTLGTVDVSSIGTAQDGSALIWSADISTWIFGVAGGSGGSSSLEDLSDTSINADPSSYSSLLYIDSKWIDQETIDAVDVFQEKLQYSTPDSSTADGSMGQIAYDDTYLYICTSTNKWGRTELSYNW